ncbi:Phospholipase A and acyltransferase 1 [Bulinus truncatus]|nr:Phospholipase A and acyltransferase 1 [Bulinus truncatus]
MCRLLLFEVTARIRFPRFPVSEILRKAESYVGQAGYNLISNNCEHFVNIVRYGKHYSEQKPAASSSTIRIEDFWKVVGDGIAYIDNDLDDKLRPMNPEKIIENALSKVGQTSDNYDSQKMADFCRYGCKKQKILGFYLRHSSRKTDFFRE